MISLLRSAITVLTGIQFDPSIRRYVAAVALDHFATLLVVVPLDLEAIL